MFKWPVSCNFSSSVSCITCGYAARRRCPMQPGEGADLGDAGREAIQYEQTNTAIDRAEYICNSTRINSILIDYQLVTMPRQLLVLILESFFIPVASFTHSHRPRHPLLSCAVRRRGKAKCKAETITPTLNILLIK